MSMKNNVVPKNGKYTVVPENGKFQHNLPGSSAHEAQPCVGVYH